MEAGVRAKDEEQTTTMRAAGIKCEILSDMFVSSESAWAALQLNYE